jgi:hypothetical protein
MAKRSDVRTKELYSEAIRQNIAKKDWPKLAEVMLVTEEVGVTKSLRKKGWFQVGLSEAEKGNHPSAIIAFNSARVLDPRPGKILSRMYEEAEAFCEDFAGRFSRQDLYMLGQALERVSHFYAFHAKVPMDVVERGKKVTRWIEARLTDAPLRDETPATHHVQRIYAALYPPMTMEEVRAEFARIVEPMMRERLIKRVMPLAGGSGKGPKDPPEDEYPLPGEEHKPSKKTPKPGKRKRRKKR